MKTLELKYWLKDKVSVPELNCGGTVVGVCAEDAGTTYRVRWFKDGEPHAAYLYEEELAERAVQAQAGFGSAANV